MASYDPVRVRNAIASIESAGSGGYAALGPQTKGDRAYGRYQIMGRNIPQWSREALGYAITPAQFMANPHVQDAIFDYKMSQYIPQYGLQGAAQAWFGGPGSVGKTGRQDVLGTSVGGYGQKFMRAYGGPSAAGGQLPEQPVPQGGVSETVTPPFGPSTVMQGLMAGPGEWMQNRSYSADALMADFFAGRNPLRRWAYQKVASLFA